MRHVKRDKNKKCYNHYCNIYTKSLYVATIIEWTEKPRTLIYKYILMDIEKLFGLRSSGIADCCAYSLPFCSFRSQKQCSYLRWIIVRFTHTENIASSALSSNSYTQIALLTVNSIFGQIASSTLNSRIEWRTFGVQFDVWIHHTLAFNSSFEHILRFRHRTWTLNTSLICRSNWASNL